MRGSLRLRWTCLTTLALSGCGGTLATVHTPSLPEPPKSKFESFDHWDARVNAAATAPSTAPTPAPATSAQS